MCVLFDCIYQTFVSSGERSSQLHSPVRTELRRASVKSLKRTAIHFSYDKPIIVNTSVVLLRFVLGYVKKRYFSGIVRLSCSNFLEITDNLVYACK